MESPTLELTLYTKPPENPKDTAKFLNDDTSSIRNPSEQHEQKLQSMPLLKDVIESLKEDATMMRQKLKSESQSKRTAMDFLTLKRSSDEEQRAFLEKDFTEGDNFLGSSALIWSPDHDTKQKIITRETATPNKFLACKVGAGRGAFKPYKRTSIVPLAAAASVGATTKDKEFEAAWITGHRYGGVNMRSIGLDMATAMWQNRERSFQLRAMEQQPGLKNLYKRNWSPELHDRFMQAVEFLGGPNVATPKQIMEIMKIDSLTINQVKSHLQKYRLNKKRFPEAADHE